MRLKIDDDDDDDHIIVGEVGDKQLISRYFPLSGGGANAGAGGGRTPVNPHNIISASW
jgi:hypothetical protein